MASVKQLVWLLILVFGTAISQVQAVDVRLIPDDPACCCCGDSPGACGMPDCIPAPVSGCSQSTATLQTPAGSVARRAAIAQPAAREPFFASFLPRVVVAPALPVIDQRGSGGEVPLFKAHCSFLL